MLRRVLSSALTAKMISCSTARKTIIPTAEKVRPGSHGTPTSQPDDGPVGARRQHAHVSASLREVIGTASALPVPLRPAGAAPPALPLPACGEEPPPHEWRRAVWPT